MTEEKKERFELLLEEIRDKVQVVSEGHEIIRSEMKQSEERIKTELRQELGGKIDAAHSSLKKEIKVTAYAVKDELSGEIKQIDEKLDKHLKVPHAA